MYFEVLWSDTICRNNLGESIMEYLKKSIRDVDVRGKKILLRCDFNVPQDGHGGISDDKRIREALPTIRYLISQGAAVIVCSHLGRPKGERKMKYTLTPIANHLSTLLNVDVKMCFDTIGSDADRLCGEIALGEIVMLENLRFDPREENNDPEFAKKLASYADIYVNDAFGAAHRSHASITGVAKYIPAVCGFLIEKELDVMGRAMQNPERPFVAIMGGSKVADKLSLIESFIGKCDKILVVGGMAYTFFKANGGEIGNSICDDKSLDLVKSLALTAAVQGTSIHLPVDTIVSDQFSNDSNFEIVSAGQIPENSMGMDIGPKTVELFSNIIKSAKTIVWNGPAGVFEMPNFAKGTEGIARAVADSGALSIIGGGDSAAAIEKLGLNTFVTHVSTGGGAAIQFLEGSDLPGISCLLDK